MARSFSLPKPEGQVMAVLAERGEGEHEGGFRGAARVAGQRAVQRRRRLLGGVPRTKIDEFLLSHPWPRTLLMRLPIPTEFLFGLVAGKPHSMVLLYTPAGDLKNVLEYPEVTFFSTLALEHRGKLYLGSAFKPHIAVYTLPV